MKLQPYTFSIRYRPGALNANADILSRLFEEEEDINFPNPSSSDNGRRGEMLGGSPARRQPPNMETRDSQHGDKRQCLRTDNIVV